MCVSLAGFCIAEEGINDIKENGPGTGIEGLDIFESFNGLFIVGGMFAFTEEKIDGYIEDIGNFQGHLDGGAVLVAFILADDIPGSIDGFSEVSLCPVFAFAEFRYFAADVEHVLLKMVF